MEGEREAEGDPAAFGDLGDLLGGEVEAHAQRLEHVGGAGPAARGPVAVLDHLGAGAGHDDGRHRGDVDRHRAVAAGADDVDRRAPGGEAVGVLEHHARQARHLGGGLALGPQRREEARELRVGGRAGHHLVHDPARGAGRQVLAAGQGGEDVGPGMRHGGARGRGGAGGVLDRWGHRRARSATAAVSRASSSGRESAASAWDHVASQPSPGRPVSTRIGGQSNNSFLSWRQMPIPP